MSSHRRALVINSHINNSIALDHLLTSLSACQELESLAHIIVVVGGYDSLQDYTVHTTKDPKTLVVHAPHNSIDFTGLLTILDMPQLKHDSYFYIHDTTRAGPDFVRHLMAIPHTAVTASFRWPSMNMGLYSHEWLEKNKAVVEVFRNPCTSVEAAQRFKALCVAREDCVFRENIYEHLYLSTGPPIVTGPTDYYGTGVQRIVEHYPTMDLYKIKANWYVKPEYQLAV